MTLGAVLGGSITFLIIAPESSKQFALTTSAIAFLTGLGTKVIYGGLERLIEMLVEGFNLKVGSERATDKDSVSLFLAERLREIDTEERPEEYEMLVKLLEEHSHRNMIP